MRFVTLTTPCPTSDLFDHRRVAVLEVAPGARPTSLDAAGIVRIVSDSGPVCCGPIGASPYERALAAAFDLTDWLNAPPLWMAA